MKKHSQRTKCIRAVDLQAQTSHARRQRTITRSTNTSRSSRGGIILPAGIWNCECCTTQTALVKSSNPPFGFSCSHRLFLGVVGDPRIDQTWGYAIALLAEKQTLFAALAEMARYNRVIRMPAGPTTMHFRAEWRHILAVNNEWH